MRLNEDINKKYFQLQIFIPTGYHHNSITELSDHWGMWKVGEGFPARVLPKTIKWVVVYSSVMFHING